MKPWRFESWLDGIVPPGRDPYSLRSMHLLIGCSSAITFTATWDRNPFGHAALDIKAFYMGLHGSSWKETAMRNVVLGYLDGQINQPQCT